MKKFAAIAFIALAATNLFFPLQKKPEKLKEEIIKIVEIKGKTKTYEEIKKIGEKDYKEVIKNLKTPEEVSIYCTEILKYDINFNPVDFRSIHKAKKGRCLHAAIAAAEILRDDNFHPYILDLKGKFAHVVFLYRTKEGFGSIGINKEDFKFGKNLKELVDSLNYSHKEKFKIIGIYDLDDFLKYHYY